MQVVDIFLNRNPTHSNANSQESLHSALENTEILEHKMLDSDFVGRGHHFGGGIARARFNSHDSRGAAGNQGNVAQGGAGGPNNNG